MGTGSEHRRPLTWQGNLANMKRYGTRLAQVCGTRDCLNWTPLDLDELMAAYGPSYMLWDKRPACRRCGARTHFMASPGDSTPFRPLLSGAVGAARRQAFLRAFGFSRRDVLRIKALAEGVTDTYAPAALDDLDVPYRVGAYRHDGHLPNGDVLGEWAGRVLLYWPLTGMTYGRWERRRPGPRRL
jgi:hypothetical protein